MNGCRNGSRGGAAPELIMVAGGSRSGKSSVSESLLSHYSSVVYLATLEVFDEEMRERVQLHRIRRPSSWRTVEAPLALKEAFEGVDESVDALLVDCLTGWLSNRLLAAEAGCKEGESIDLGPILTELDAVLLAIRKAPVKRIVVVTSEVGGGVIPATSLGRRFCDLQGWANQRLAAAADRVLFVQFGLVTELKPVRQGTASSSVEPLS